MLYSRYPYEALSKHGIHPRASAKEIQDFIPTQREESEAWQVLRDMRSRLKIDFFLYQTADEEQLAGFQEQLHQSMLVPQHSLLLKQLKEDAPMILLLSGRREEAKRIMEDRIAINPADVRAAHRLALLYYTEAKQSAESEHDDLSTAAWQQTIAYWVRTLVDDEYWNEWCDDRRRYYQERASRSIKIGFKTAARNDLHKFLLTEILELVDSFVRTEKLGQADAFAELLSLYEAERSGAEALKDAGGIVTDNGQLVTCGPLLLKKLGLSHELNKLIGMRHDELYNYERLPAAKALIERLEPPVSSTILRQLRLYFSNLLPVVAQLNLNKPEEALKILTAMSTSESSVADELYLAIKDGATLYRKDIAELAIEAHLSIALRHLTSVPPNLKAAETAWRDMMKRTVEFSLRRQATQAICDQALGRVQALQEDRTRDTMDQLTEAIEILERANSVLRGSNNEEVTAMLAEKLSLRGAQYFIQDEDEQAADDLRRAFDLKPKDAYIRDQYSYYLLNFAKQKVNSNRDEALTLMEQAKRLVDQGLVDYPDDEDLLYTRQLVQNEMYILLHDGSSDYAWAEVDQILQQFRQPSEGHAYRERVKKAEEKRESGDYQEAAKIIEQVLSQKPDYAWARAEALEIYVAWGFDLLEEGIIEEAQSKASHATRYGIQSLRLEELQEQIEQTRALLEER
jgi:hypothetical protein